MSIKEKFMSHMMNSMMNGNNSMMHNMNCNKDDKNENSFSSMDMCKKMFSNMSKNSDIATFATPEVRQLFEEWVQQIDEEILTIIENDSTTTVESIATHLKISKESVNYFISRLAQQGKISLNIRKNV